jgi:single-stranded-DNA-specific exonuclease
MDAARVPEFRARINDYADARLEPEDLMPRLRIDAALGLRAINPDVVEGLSALEPFGLGNPRPVFHADPVEIIDGPRVLKDRHLRMTFRQDGRVFRGIAWRAAERAGFLDEHRAGLALAFSLDRDEYQGETYVQLSMADAKPAGHLR